MGWKLLITEKMGNAFVMLTILMRSVETHLQLTLQARMWKQFSMFGWWLELGSPYYPASQTPLRYSRVVVRIIIISCTRIIP